MTRGGVAATGERRPVPGEPTRSGKWHLHLGDCQSGTWDLARPGRSACDSVSRIFASCHILRTLSQLYYIYIRVHCSSHLLTRHTHPHMSLTDLSQKEPTLVRG